MDGGTIIAAVVATQGALSGVTIYATRKIVSTAVRALTDRIDREREDRLRVEGELKVAADSHGHVGLKGNDAKVTR